MKDKPLVILHGDIKTPPLSSAARIEAGFLLRQLQQGEFLPMLDSRPMPSVVSVLKRRFWPILHEREIPKMLIYNSKLRFLKFPFKQPRLKIRVLGQKLA